MSRRWDQPGITIRLEPPSRHRDVAILDDVERVMAESGPTSALVLLAHPLIRTRLLGRLLDGHPHGRLLPQLRSLSSFALEAADVDESVVPVDAGLRRSLLTELIADRRDGRTLSALAAGRDLPGLVRAIDHFFQALGRQRVWTSAALDTLIHVYRRGRIFRVDRDVVALYDRYRALLPRRPQADTSGLVTPLEIMDRVAANSQVLDRLLAGVRRVVVMGFDDLTPVHASLVAAIARCDGVRATTVVLETVRSADAADEDWTRLFSDVPVRVQQDEDTPPPPVRFALALAGGDAEDAASVGPALAPHAMTLTTHASPVDEVKAIARHVASHIQNGGRLDAVAVAFPNAERFLPLVRDVFPRHDIPFATPVGVSLAAAPPVAAMRALLALVQNGFERTDVERFLSTRLLRLPNAASRPLLAIDTCARAARVTGGRGRPDEEWLRPIEGLLDRPRARRPEEAVIRAALSDLTAFFAATDPLSRLVTRRVPVHDFASALGAVSATLGLNRPMDEPEMATANARDHAARVAFEERLLAYRRTLAHVTPTPEHRLAGWIDRLDALLSEERIRPAEETVGGVSVLGLGDVRHVGAGTVFLGGLTEADIPRRSRSDLLYPATRDDARDFLPHRNTTEEDAHALFGEIGRRTHLHLSWSNRIDHVDTLRSTLLDRLTDVATLSPLPESDVPPLPEDRVLDWTKRVGRGAVDVGHDILGSSETGALARRSVTRLLVETTRRLERPSAYTGFVDTDDFRDTAGRAYAPGGSHTFSPSAIETYAQCGFRFLAAHVLELRRVDDIEEELTPSTRGRLLHAILRRFHADRSRRGDDANSVTADRTDELRRELFAIAEDVLAEIPDDDLLWRASRDAIAGTLSTSTTRRPSVLTQFLDAEIDRWADGWRPERLEWAFGMGERPAAVLDTPRGGVRFRGKIDRVDRHASGDVLVLDYKSGQAPRHRDVDDGTRFQLPLYLFAAGALVEDATGWDAAYYPLKLGTGLTPHGHLSGVRRGGRGTVDRDALLEGLRERIDALAGAMAAGSFPRTLLPSAKSPCRYCDYRTLCRVEGTSPAERRRVLTGSGACVYEPAGDDA